MISKIKICHFTSVHNRYDVRVFNKQCLTLFQSGYDVHLVVADGKGNEIKDGIKIHDIGRMHSRLSRIIFSPVRMANLLLSLNCRIYQFHDPELLFLGLFIKIFTKSKVIYDSHECNKDYFLHKDYISPLLRPISSKMISFIEHFVGKQLNWIIVTTEQHYQALKTINKNVSIIYNYPMLSEWVSADDKQHNEISRSICYIGNINEERGIKQLIKAIADIDCTLHLAGYYDPVSFRDELTKLPGWNKVIEYGYVNREQAAMIVSKSLCGVVLFLPYPLHYTSLSTKVFEYMAGGIACLVPDFPIWKEIVETNECGLSTNPTDVSMISQTIDYMLNNPELVQKMGQRGKELVRTKYNWDTQIPELLDIYNTLSIDS